MSNSMSKGKPGIGIVDLLMLGWKCKESENSGDFVVPLMAVSPNVLGNILFSFL